MLDKAHRTATLPDIMDGLGHCIQAKCDGCPYDKTGNDHGKCLRSLMTDAWLMIMGLEERLGEFEEDVDTDIVQHGRWREESHDKDVFAVCFECSNCGEEVVVSTDGATIVDKWRCDYDYCPYCGAKMDLEADDEA